MIICQELCWHKSILVLLRTISKIKNTFYIINIFNLKSLTKKRYNIIDFIYVITNKNNINNIYKRSNSH